MFQRRRQTFPSCCLPVTPLYTVLSSSLQLKQRSITDQNSTMPQNIHKATFFMSFFAGLMIVSCHQLYDSIDFATMDKYGDEWSRLHSSWIGIDRNFRLCDDATQTTAYPLCLDDKLISDTSVGSQTESDLLCRAAMCLSKDTYTRSCAYSPFDTIDYLPPTATTSLDNTTICSIPDTFSIMGDPDISSYSFGLDLGIPPAYLPIVPIRLNITGLVTTITNGAHCTPIVNAEIVAWQVDPTKLTKYTIEAQRLHELNVAASLEATKQGTPFSRSTTGGTVTPTPQTQVGGVQGVSLRDISSRARQHTSESGSYHFITLMPPSYGPPRHIMFQISAPGYETLTTRVYFDKDWRLQQLTTLEGNVNTDTATSPDSLPQALGFQSDRNYSTEQFLNAPVNKDPRVAKLTFRPTATQTLKSVVNGVLETEYNFVLRPTRSELVEATTARAADGATDSLNLLASDRDMSGGPPVDLNGIWADTQGALVRIETHGPSFIAGEYPHPRTWGSVTGLLAGNVIRNVDFRRVQSQANLEDAAKRQVPAEAEVHLSSTTWTAAGPSSGTIVTSDPFATDAFTLPSSQAMSIQWSGGGLDSLWTKQADTSEGVRGYRYLKLTITRETSGLAGGALMLNEIEFFQGILSQEQHPVEKMTNPRFPAPQMVTCSSFLDQDHHCYKAFDRDLSSHSAWVTQGVGSRRTALSAAQWVVFDFGEGRGVSPTAMRLLCDVQEAEQNARGCPRTFTLSGSHDNTKYDLLYKQDLFDYNKEYGPVGLMSYFIYDTIKGRPNGQRCGSCSTGPLFTCALDGYDGSCDSRYCGQNALCSAEPSCPPGEYMHYGFKGHAQPFFQCKQCAAGRYGAVAGLRSPACSGLCSAGYYCPAGSVTDTAFPCGGAQFYCPEGSPRPIPAAAGRFTLSWEDLNPPEPLSAEPSFQPSREPSQSPSYDPSVGPTTSPTRTPTAAPSTTAPSGPSAAPTLLSTVKPTATPTAKPSAAATNAPTLPPTAAPSLTPSHNPTRTPTVAPSQSSLPSAAPSHTPSNRPTTKPTATPSITPSRTPTAVPSTSSPSMTPTFTPTMAPASPTAAPMFVPSLQPAAVQAAYRVAEQLCPRGHYCTKGLVHPCPVGRYGNITGLQTSECSFACQAGTYCPEGSVLPTICPLGHYCPDGKEEVACPAGTFGGKTGLKSRQCSGYCQLGHFCPVGSISATSQSCPAGTYGDVAGLSNNSCAGLCAAGYYCPLGSVISKQTECGDASVYCPEGSAAPTSVDLGYYTVGGDSERTRTAQSKAEVGYYATEGVKWPCRAGSYGEEMGLSADTFHFETFPPSSAPTVAPSRSPTRTPSLFPTAVPSRMPSATPSAPTITAFPTFKPSSTPTCVPSWAPTRMPTALPTTSSPSRAPSAAPSTSLPTVAPTLAPSRAPTAMPSAPTRTPTIQPSRSPTRSPTLTPTRAPSGVPTFSPNSGTRSPSRIPTRTPTFAPTWKPSTMPSIFQPSALPTFALLWTRSPTSSPTTEAELPYEDFTCSGLCSVGHYCPRNSSVQIPCPAGRYGSQRGLTSNQCTATCPLGHFCPTGSVLPTPCPAGVFGNTTGLTDAICSALCWSGGCSPTSNLCFEGYYCPKGSISGTQMQCGGADRYCPRGSATPLFVSPGHYTIGGTQGRKDNFVTNTVDSSNRQLTDNGDTASFHTRVAQTICEEGHYCMDGIKRNCPPGVYGSSKGLVSAACSGACALGHYCPEGSVNATTYKCPAGRYGATTNLGDSACSGRCAAGFHCGPASTFSTQLECAVVKRTGVYKPGFGVPAGPLKIRSNQTADQTTLRSDVYLRTFNTTTYYLPNTNLTEVQITEADAVYCPEGSAQPLLVRKGYYSQGGNRTTRSSQKPCPMGSYCINGILSSCPAGRYGRGERLTSSACTGICSKGHYCPAGSTSTTQKPCPLGRYGSTEGLTTASCTGPCGKPLDCAAGSTSSTG